MLICVLELSLNEPCHQHASNPFSFTAWSPRELALLYECLNNGGDPHLVVLLKLPARVAPLGYGKEVLESALDPGYGGNMVLLRFDNEDDRVEEAFNLFTGGARLDTGTNQYRSLNS